MSANSSSNILLFYNVVAIGLSAAGIVAALRFWFRPGAGWIMAGCGLWMGEYVISAGLTFAGLLQSWGVDTAGLGRLDPDSITAVLLQGTMILAGLSATVCLLMGFSRIIRRGRRRSAGSGGPRR